MESVTLVNRMSRLLTILANTSDPLVVKVDPMSINLVSSVWLRKGRCWSMRGLDRKIGRF